MKNTALLITLFFILTNSCVLKKGREGNLIKTDKIDGLYGYKDSIVHAQKDRSISKNDVSKPVTIEKDKTGKRLALVIGNANYKVQKSLEATDNGKQYYPPINDAKDIANKLKQFNFDVLLALDANLETQLVE